METDLRGYFFKIVVTVLSIFLFACSGSDGARGVDGDDGKQSLIVVTDEPSGENCILGGSRIDVGIDTNRNGVLDTDPNEVEHTEYVCTQVADHFDGLVFTEDVNEDRRYELFAAWPTAGSATKVAGTRLFNEYIGAIALSPDKTHVAYATLPEKTLYIADLLHPYVPPVKLSLGLYTDEQVGLFAWSPDSKRIAFTLGDQISGGKSRLFSAYQDGSAIAVLSPLTANPEPDIKQLAWSPDSQTIAYVYDFQRMDIYLLCVVKPNGNDHTFVSEEGQTIDQTIVWAPDSSRIAYMDAGRNSVYTATTEAGSWVNVSGVSTVVGGEVRKFLWSADSSHIAFRANYEDINVDDLFVTMADNLDRIRISQHLMADSTIVSSVYEFDWSADGAYLAYISDQDVDNKNELYAATPQGAVTKVSSASDDAVDGFAWSTAGSGLAYTRGAELNFVDADGTNHQNVDTVLNQIKGLYWSPNGSYLAYVPYDVSYDSSDYGIVKVVDSSGNNAVQVSPLISDGGIWDIYTELWWSPESDQLAFEIAYPHASLAATVGMTELYSVFPDGSGLHKLSQRDKPDVLSGLSDLGVMHFQFQGNSGVHE